MLQSRESTKAVCKQTLHMLSFSPQAHLPSLPLSEEGPQPSFLVSPPAYYSLLSVVWGCSSKPLLQDTLLACVACIDKLVFAAITLSFVAGFIPT